jgi:hypothetical protein
MPLKHLNLSKNEISDQGGLKLAAALRNNKTLLTLNLEGNELANAAAEALGTNLLKNQSLLHLELVNNRRMELHFVERIQAKITKNNTLMKEQRLLTYGREKRDLERQNGQESKETFRIFERDQKALVREQTQYNLLKKEFEETKLTEVEDTENLYARIGTFKASYSKQD